MHGKRTIEQLTMQSVEFFIEKHDEQINEIKNGMADLSSKMNVIINDYKHLSEKMQEALVSMKKLSEVHITLPMIETQILSLKEKIGLLELEHNNNKELLKDLEMSNRKWATIKHMFVRHWFPLLCVIALGVAWAVDFIYRMNGR